MLQIDVAEQLVDTLGKAEVLASSLKGLSDADGDVANLSSDLYAISVLLSKAQELAAFVAERVLEESEE